MVSDNDTTCRAVLVMLATIAVITSVTIAVIISGHSGNVTPTGIIKDTGRAGNPGGTSAQVWIQELPRHDCGPDEVGVWLPINRLAAEWRCIAKDAVK